MGFVLEKAWIAWLIIAVCALLCGAFALGYVQGKAVCKSEWQIAENALLTEALTMRDEYEKVLNESKAKQVGILSDFASANDELVQLRNAVERSVQNGGCANDSKARLHGELFAECTAKYIEVAKYADIHALDAETCVNAWGTR